MRFSASTALLALPALGMAAEEGGFFGQYKAQFQNLMGSLGVATPAAPTDESVTTAAAAAAAAASTPSSVPVSTSVEELTLENWQSTLYSVVEPDATEPEEWRVLITGRNKTCFGRCDKIDDAFAAATILAAAPGVHAATLNCDDQPVLCNSWSGMPGFLYIFELLPKPAATDIYTKSLNLSSTTPETFVELYADKSRTTFTKLDSYFHPLDGVLAQNGLAVPFGYVMWAFGLVPSWAFMIAISFISRTFM
ncbi:hypothetical protein SEPCBS119000_005652 [Sporothrix epigloea]|uniref:Peptidyl-tRNA hydrolase n=1 Tax=Sporothrix epigloea TaxID=1892477 RepID=A0ABP0E2U1_9PEZI